MKTNSEYMDEAISLAESCLCDMQRSPFGTVIVKGDKIVGRGKESTRIKKDPTAHSEVEAVRDACKTLDTHNLKGCIMFSSSEPCSMCLAATLWAQIDTIYYACSRESVFEYGLPDRFTLVEKRKGSGVYDFKFRTSQIKSERAEKVFRDWRVRQSKSR